MLVILALFIALAILTPLFGADSRDGLDWSAGHFWFHRRPARGGRRAGPAEHRSTPDGQRSTPDGHRHPRNRRPVAAEDVRTPGSPGRAFSVPCAADGCRTAPAAG
jgi:hypothetical protein